MSVNLDSITGIPWFDHMGTGDVGQMTLQVVIILLTVYFIYSSLGSSNNNNDDDNDDDDDDDDDDDGGNKNLKMVGLGILFLLLILFLFSRFSSGGDKFTPSVLLIVFFIVILYFILFSSLGKGRGSAVDEDGEVVKGKGSEYLGIGTVSIFIVLLLMTGFTYFLNFNVITSVKDIFSKKPEIDFEIKSIGDQKQKEEPIPEIQRIKQVYNIPDNKYTYNDAKALCTAYGSRLANYKDVKAAYDKGANWCSYGWSDNQFVLFPTQDKTWKKLQKIKGHENDCGRPGINGGYIGNPNAKFGVNCFGHKPKINPLESQLMQDLPKYPKSQDEINFEKKVKYWRTKVKDILVAPFNNKNWSML